MAGDWIKMRVDLLDDPAVIGIADKTGLDEFAVVGRLHKLWSWADRHTLNGNGVSVTEHWVDRFIDCENFGAAMLQVGWLEQDAGHVAFPNFDRHNGETAKKRALTNKRVAEHRELQRNSNDDGNAGSNAGSVTKSVTREEKRREDTLKPTAPSGAVVPAGKSDGDLLGDGPSLNGKARRIPPCPHEKIVALYHELLPTLDGVRVWNDQRQGYARSRWRETFERLHDLKTEADGLQWFRELFESVALRPWLMGQVQPRDGGQPFRADLEWLLRPKNFAKLIEGKWLPQ